MSKRFIRLGAILAGIFLALTIFGFSRGNGYWQSCPVRADYQQYQNQFSQQFQPFQQSDPVTGQLGYVDPDYNEDQAEHPGGVLEGFEDQITNDLRQKGKIGFVIQPTWSSEGTPAPLIFVLN